MEVPLDLTVLGIVISIVLGSIVIVGRLPQFSENSVKLLKTRVKERDELIEELRSDIKTYKNRYFNLQNKIEQEPEVDLPQLTGDLTSPDNIKAVISTFLPAISGYLPKWAGPLLNNPAIAGMAIDYFSKHPDQVMSLIGKFTKGKSQEKALPEGMKLGKEEVPVNYTVY